MREWEWNGAGAGSSPAGSRRRYFLLTEDIEAEGFQCESYGLAVRDAVTGEEAAARHITVSAARAMALLETAARLEVTPVTLGDVVEDYLGQ